MKIPFIKTKKQLLKLYDESKDLSKQGELRRKTGEGDSELAAGKLPVETGEQGVLPVSETPPVRKDSKSSRGILRKFRRKK